MEVLRRFAQIALLLGAVTLLGTFGIYWIEDSYSLLDALYMTIITLTTVGYREVHPLSTGGRIFVMLYLALGLGVFLYSLVSFGELIVSTQLRELLGRRNMDSNVKALKSHYIVCGFGRMGVTICEQLHEQRIDFVVVDSNEENLEACRARGWHWLLGDATDDEVLQAAGVERARGLAAVLATDADNLFVVFSARLVAPDLRILARASENRQISKLKKAGADRVVSPYAVGASKIAQLLVNPHVEDFLELVGSGLDVAEVQVGEDSGFRGKALSETEFTSLGIVIVGLRKSGGELLLPPPSTARLELGDSLIALGSPSRIEEFCARV